MRMTERIAKLELALGAGKMSPQEMEDAKAKLLKLLQARCNAQPVEARIEATSERKSELIAQLKDLAARVCR